MSIAENIARVRANIAAAAKEAGRDVSEITLVGASKMNDADACRAAIAAGIDVLGENREQEMTKKLAEHAYDGAPLHFIGHLQRNKVKNVVGKVAVIESVGSLALLAAINAQAEKLGNFSFVLHNSSTDGRFDATKLVSGTSMNPAEADLWFCGPPPLRLAIEKGLKELGKAPRRVEFERFEFR